MCRHIYNWNIVEYDVKHLHQTKPNQPYSPQTSRFNSDFTNFSFLINNIPDSPAYGVIISQLKQYAIIIPPATKLGGGVYWNHPVRPSVRPSVRLSVCRRARG